MNTDLAGIIEQTAAIAQRLDAVLVDAREDACSILALVESAPDEIRADLGDEAKRLCDNLRHEVAIYSFLGGWTRALSGPVRAAGGPELQKAFAELWVQVMGD